MNKFYTPSLWLLTLIVGLPQFSETIYTPALPDIAQSLSTTPELVELTLTIYLAGFAIGTFFWGVLSDFLGRKPALLMGLLLYLLGCAGCYYSHGIEMLLFYRFLQALGGSTGSVLGQAICRDTFQGKRLGEVYAAVGSALALSPAIGPVLGGVIDQWFGWSANFLLLILLGSFVALTTFWKLAETKQGPSTSLLTLKEIGKKMAGDPRLISFGVLVAACNGILFSYYAEGSFYLIDLLGLSPSFYGTSFIALACAGIFAGITTRKLYHSLSVEKILTVGARILLTGCCLFALLAASFHYIPSKEYAILCTIISMTIVQFGSGIVLTVSLSKALENYRDAIGSASSIFGLFYYILIALVTFGMAILHSTNSVVMPLYFLTIGLVIRWTVAYVTKPVPLILK